MPRQHIWLAKLYVGRAHQPVVKAAWSRTALPAAAAEEGKGLALLLLSQGYSWTFPTSYSSTCPLPVSAPYSCLMWNSHPWKSKGEGSMAGHKPSLFPSQILTLVCFCSSSTTGRRAPLSPSWGGQELWGWRLPGSWLWLPGADSLRRAALPNARDPEGYL